jgi:hypothetical protein
VKQIKNQVVYLALIVIALMTIASMAATVSAKAIVQQVRGDCAYAEWHDIPANDGSGTVDITAQFFDGTARVFGANNVATATYVEVTISHDSLPFVITITDTNPTFTWTKDHATVTTKYGNIAIEIEWQVNPPTATTHLRGDSDVEKLVINQNGRLGTATLNINGRCGYLHSGSYPTEYAVIYSHVETDKLKL